MKARAVHAPPLAETNGSRLFLLACAWGVHLYTALGAVFGVLAIHYAAIADYRASFLAMAVTIAIASSDGTLARFINVKKRVPGFDGALLDNIVDYLTYVVAPVFLMIRAGLVVGTIGFAVAGFVLIASAYQFCQTDAKTSDHFFLGFPSYWNLVVFYLYCFGWGVIANELILALFAVMVFVPIKYIYPSRTKVLRPLTLTLAITWGIVAFAMLLSLPAIPPLLLYLSLPYIAYYFIASFALHARSMGGHQVS
jgi:phosphatidylcholine synthase